MNMHDHTFTVVVVAGHNALANGRRDVADVYARTVLRRAPGHPGALLLGMAVELSRATDALDRAEDDFWRCRGLAPRAEVQPLPYARGFEPLR